ncbi:phosphate system positive regulatory protein pho81 [Cryomyces antarcticus]|uniref:Phosphate system positive regulatory protein pho81 n=1 Tax=Cryomyces antarcticus TaxID=329879 RepID=A0ABR0KSR6_9PEZI|nr:phosphate system positive regulatory protein pho81 [Cryomyces antarcticus]KAK5109154.1 phosphate system positive regulatory protein pho81 [Cryomyces antarcticus]
MLAASFASLHDALAQLPLNVHVEVHVLYPTKIEEDRLLLGPTQNINEVANAILTVVFNHARHLREQSDSFVRSVVFSSFNQDVCTALNWKQPNYPVLLCNELGADTCMPARDPQKVLSSGRTTISIREAVRIAQSNNFMGLICSSHLLVMQSFYVQRGFLLLTPTQDRVPALIESIKVSGLVLITDMSDISDQHPGRNSSFRVVPKGVDGVLKSSGVLRFNETIDI